MINKHDREHRNYVLILFITFIIIYVFSLMFALKTPMVYESREYPMWKFVKERINSNSNIYVKALIIGDSRAKAGFEPNLASFNSLNLAIGGSTAIEGYYTLLNYIKNNPVPENVVLSYSPYYLTNNSYYWERTVKYKYLSDDQYTDIFNNSKIFSERGIGDIDISWKYSYLTSMYISSIFNGIIENRWISNYTIYENLKNSIGHAYFGVQNGSDSFNDEVKRGDNFVPSELIYFYIIKLANLAKKHGIKLHWYTMPFNNSSCSKIPSDYISKYDTYIDSVSSKAGINVIKKSHCLDNKFFGDGSHLFSGSSITTREISSVLK